MLDFAVAPWPVEPTIEQTEQHKVIDCLKRFFYQIEMMIEAVAVEVGANIVYVRRAFVCAQIL